ncbi:methyltransferase domain-containing protein [Pseudofrankia sp. BMG5.37]|uniref:methyltransferase domain-containing protein n=1 Tax=Pseudofrankia sp. BMG5.37 TaxID=3050035 RepID=UPI002895188E|nr:methyltransferase domain-containing protein [Pseudofrankia sp. BMG5.37]MDT3445829.1 SAM-dependent methyltransferase [Pseudofrankia sp. BMG5.37]
MTTAAAGDPTTAAHRDQPGRRGLPVRDGSPPTALYEAALRSAAGRLWVRYPDGRRDPLPVPTWRGGLVQGDTSLLRRCAGPTLDIGCGPGRLAAALAARGLPTLGIDVAAFAVHLARRAGATALCRDVFGPLPAEGRWSTLLLADGNIGIGGDPGRLLTRAAELLGPAGRVLVELQPHPAPPGRRLVRLEGPDGRLSRAFPWACVGTGEILGHATTAGLHVVETWCGGGRPFAALG